MSTTETFRREALELKAILDTMADGVYVIDRDRKILRWNHAMERLSGYGAEEAVGNECGFLKPDPAVVGDQACYLTDERVFAEGHMEKREALLRRKDGRHVPVLASASVLTGEDGELVGAVVTLTDISSIKQLENEVSELRREVEQQVEFENIVGKSARMQEVFRLIELAAAVPVTVLVHGETGTGKELVAKAIHYRSDRRDGPLVSVNCSALSESLLESELFGHVRGAFTGAVSDRVGRFEAASGGTIFLDEVGELPPVVQVKLLRVLQEHAYERVGDTQPRSADVRVIAATHRDLRALVQSGDFRQDLFYRLKVFPIHLPPLRERKEDIGPLVRRFIERFREKTGKLIEDIAPEAMRIVMDYCWPGNVRELENAVEHAFVTCPGEHIGPFDLPIEVRRVELKRELCEGIPPPQAPANAPVRGRVTTKRRRTPSREDLLVLLDECGWNKAEVARRLGMDRTSVWRKMKALGLPLEPPE